jgi:leucyl-tRNA synthetase
VEIKERFPKWLRTYEWFSAFRHLGHGLIISKIGFGAGYQRMLGKRVLFFMGFIMSLTCPSGYVDIPLLLSYI